MLAGRLISFADLLLMSPKLSVRVMARHSICDLRTVLGQNLHKISKECGLKHFKEGCLSPCYVKKTMKYFEIPQDELWRPRILKELLSHVLCEVVFDDHEKEGMINYLCTT